ncbi:MAG TPA: RidA family protein [Chitinophagaceae bacterium]
MRIIITAFIIFCSLLSDAQGHYEQRIKELGITLHEPSKPQASFVRVVKSGNLLFLAGHGPTKSDGSSITGKLGTDLNLDQGIEATKTAAINILSVLKYELNDLDRIKRIIKLTGWVNCDQNFTKQHLVMNGCSDLLVSIFGDQGKHARSSIGTNSLPNNIAVEIEMVIEIE